MEYSELFVRLQNEVAVVTFLKKNGQVRNMVCTRDYDTLKMLQDYNGYGLDQIDRRCNIGNKLVGVIDIQIQEARSFSIERVLSLSFAGKIDTEEKLEKLLIDFNEFKEEYEKISSSSMTMDMLD